MNLIPKFTETSLSEKKIIYNYTTEKGTYNATDNKIDLVVSPNNNFFVLENEDMQSFSAKNIYFTKCACKAKILFLDSSDYIQSLEKS